MNEILEVYSAEGSIATLLNGVLIGIGETANPRIGHIALQSEGVAAEFRNIGSPPACTFASFVAKRRAGEVRVPETLTKPLALGIFLKCLKAR